MEYTVDIKNHVMEYLVTWNKSWYYLEGKTHCKNSKYSVIIFIENGYIWIIRLNVWQTLIG